MLGEDTFSCWNSALGIFRSKLRPSTLWDLHNNESVSAVTCLVLNLPHHRECNGTLGSECCDWFYLSGNLGIQDIIMVHSALKTLCFPQLPMVVFHEAVALRWLLSERALSSGVRGKAVSSHIIASMYFLVSS